MQSHDTNPKMTQDMPRQMRVRMAALSKAANKGGSTKKDTAQKKALDIAKGRC